MPWGVQITRRTPRASVFLSWTPTVGLGLYIVRHLSIYVGRHMHLSSALAMLYASGFGNEAALCSPLTREAEGHVTVVAERRLATSISKRHHPNSLHIRLLPE